MDPRAFSYPHLNGLRNCANNYAPVKFRLIRTYKNPTFSPFFRKKNLLIGLLKFRAKRLNIHIIFVNLRGVIINGGVNVVGKGLTGIGIILLVKFIKKRIRKIFCRLIRCRPAPNYAFIVFNNIIARARV